MEALKLLKEEAARKRKALKEIGKVLAGEPRIVLVCIN